MAFECFSTRFCKQFDCPISEYQAQAFKKLLYSHSKPVALVIGKLKPNYFRDDFKFIDYLGEAVDYCETAASVADFRERNLGNGSFLRKHLKIRVSGRKAGRLVRLLFLAAGD